MVTNCVTTRRQKRKKEQRKNNFQLSVRLRLHNRPFPQLLRVKADNANLRKTSVLVGCKRTNDPLADSSVARVKRHWPPVMCTRRGMSAWFDFASAEVFQIHRFERRNDIKPQAMRAVRRSARD